MTVKLMQQVSRFSAIGALLVAGGAHAVSLEAGDFDVSMYGYARLNMAYDLDANLGDGGTTGAANIGNVNTGDSDVAEGHFNADANQSRLGFSIGHTSGVNVKIESDFVGGPRLRHAYGTYQGVLAGQTWSNYTSFVGNTSTLDFNSTYGLAGFQARFTQLRYTTGGLSFSIEDPRTVLAGGLEKKDSMPAVTARYEGKAGDLSYSVAGLVRQAGYDDGADDDTVMGYGAFAAARFSLTDRITIQGAVNYSDGTTSYLYIAPGPDAFLDSDGDLETVSGYGATLGMGVKTGSGSFNVGYGMVSMDLDDAVDAGAVASSQDETRSTAFVNYQWNPVENVMYGVELGHFAVDDQSGDDGDATRILFAAQYNF
ncbi:MULTISPECIES: DcaP family trimeric outer membrane transporter [Marinobacter]|uniref:DcaP family trimeric outer membrane transporter n=1 Tax=Marinobacter TaxID=2742 RepID=UPI000DAC26F9|nr:MULTISPECIES: DcaP family trimeric outer membrane transporter [Marinobacter]